MKLRSIELEFPNVPESQRFLTEVWGLVDAGKRGNTTYLRATGDQPYVVALTEAPAKAVASVTFSGTKDEVQKALKRVEAAGLEHGPMQDFDEPGSAHGFLTQGREGQVYRFVTEKEATKALPDDKNKPQQLSHVVLNVKDREAATKFAQEVLGFKLSDRTRVMSFVRCDSTHHCIAYADADASTLNHMAFEMVDLDSVMNGLGRMKEAGYPTVWGPGRHGPGNNVFGYFVAPFGAVIEYTSEVQRVDDSYRTGAPEDWTWPAGRGDHWGIAGRDMQRMHEAERTFRFKAFKGAKASV
jgi:2,3-dihydroxy-p-cumate/2,3-dihydroxybenzoate 3,4-dioxygenase